MDLMQKNNIQDDEGKAVVGVDRLSTLIPEVIGIIYDNFASDLDRHFLPIARSLLRSQRINLYRRVKLNPKLPFAKFCRTLTGKNGIELGRMVEELTLFRRAEWVSESGIRAIEELEWGEMMIEGQVQLILPKLTRLRTFQVRATLSAALPIIPFFSSPTHSPGSQTIVKLRLELADYTLVHLIVPYFPHLLDLSLILPPTCSALELDALAPVTALDSPIQPRQLNRLFLSANFIVPVICGVVASTEATSTSLTGEGIYKGLIALKNSDTMKRLAICAEDAGEDEEDHGQVLLKLTKVKRLKLSYDIQIDPTFFVDLFKSNPGLKVLKMTWGFPLIAADLISAIRTNPIVGLRLVLDCANQRYDEYGNKIALWDIDWPERCQEEDVLEIMMHAKSAGMEVRGAAVDIVDPSDKRKLAEWSDNQSPSEDEYEVDKKEEYEKDLARQEREWGVAY